MEATRGGLCYPYLMGIPSYTSKNLKNMGFPYRITIKPLGQLGMDGDIIVYGDLLTWEFLTIL